MQPSCGFHLTRFFYVFLLDFLEKYNIIVLIDGYKRGFYEYCVVYYFVLLLLSDVRFLVVKRNSFKGDLS